MDDNLKAIKLPMYYLTEEGWRDNYPDGKDPGIGTWNPKTRKATLIKDINRTIQIVTDNVDLCGNNYSISLTIGVGIYFDNIKNIIIRNLQIAGAEFGIAFENSSKICIKHNSFNNNYNDGILLLENNSEVVIKSNLLKNSQYGVNIHKGNTNVKILNNKIIDNFEVASCYGIGITNGGNSEVEIDNNDIEIKNTINKIDNNIFDVKGIFILNFENLMIKLVNNKITVSCNMEAVNSRYGVNISGITINQVDSNGFIINKNTIAIVNNEFKIIKDKFNIPITFLGIELSYRANDYEIEDNKVIISDNKIVTSSTEESKVESYLYAILIRGYCKNSMIKSNLIIINKNKVEWENTIFDGDILGIYLLFFEGVEVSKNTIIIKKNSWGVKECYGMALISNTIKNVIANNKMEIEGNVFRQIRGILFTFTSNNEIFNNTINISRNLLQKSYAFYFNGGNDNNTIKENNICNNQGNGIYIVGASIKNTIVNNRVCYNEKDGIVMVSNNSENIISQNKILFNGGNGLYLNNFNHKNIINNNLINHNEENGIYLENENNENTIEKNVVLNNKVADIYLEENNLNNIVKDNITTQDI